MTGRRMILLLVACTLGLFGCTPKRNPLPELFLAEATIPGLNDVRSLEAPTSQAFRDDLRISFIQARAHQAARPPTDSAAIHILTLSGGGANGAFGAGLLCGWTESGSRSQFKVVAGISTGALIAPFAFLGPDHDPTLRHLYTSLDTRDLIGLWPRMIARGTIDSLADSHKVANLIQHHYDRALIRQIARAHQQGRRLYVATASLDANRLVVWNMGAIALYDTPESTALFQKVLLAAVAIPVLFPPESFEVEARGALFDELHADGGIVRQVFAFEALFGLRALARQAGDPTARPAKIYVIQNLPTAPVYDPVQPVVTDIAGKALMDLFANQGLGDLHRIYARAEHHGLDFHLIAVPPEFKPRRRELFDQQDMQRLFAIGYARGRAGPPWQTKPPGLP